MVNKILRVGDSAAVTLPKKVLKEMGVAIGDRVVVNYLAEKNEITIHPLENEQPSITPAFASLVQEFMERYRPALQALSGR